MLRSGINVRFRNDLGAQPASSLHDRIEIVDRKPQKDAVSRRRRVGVDEVGMVFHVPSVQLKKQLARARDSIVMVAMGMFGK